MDDTNYNALKELKEALKQPLPEDSTPAQLYERQKMWKETTADLDDVIPPVLATDGNIAVDGWSDAHDAILAAWDSESAVVVNKLLPNFTSSQAKRRRIEVYDYLMVRPVFKQYEEQIFDNVSTSLFGLTGPQGFGKTVFLHCLALKRARDSLVVWIPACPRNVITFKGMLAEAFYKGCQARGLAEIPYLKRSDTVGFMLDTLKRFANEKKAKLLIIVDQMNCNLEYYGDVLSQLTDFHFSSTSTGHRLIVSSSTSGRADTSIFGSSFFPLPPFDSFLSPTEIGLLLERYPDSPNLNLVQPDTHWSFLNLISILTSEKTSLEGLASKFAYNLKTQLRVDSDATEKARMIEYMKVLQMVVASQATQNLVVFDAELVDGDLFFVKKQLDGTFIIHEYMQGFAEHVLDQIKKAEEDYRKYLESVIGSDNFKSLTRGAQGNILEDAISCILRKKEHPIKFSLTDLQGHVGNQKIGSFSLDNNRFVQTFTTIPQLDELRNWIPRKQWYVGIPPEGFTGIDFVLARVRNVGRFEKLEIFFIQSTVSTPQEHGIVKSSEQVALLKLLKKKTGILERNTNLYVTFLTPKLGIGADTGNIAYDISVCYRSSFQKLQGNDPLAKIVTDRCVAVWGS